jgi:hypothetical protein|eukprot:COSAG01_NODE_7327_length_3250_cov_3.910505_5_plen_210_part_00
MNPNTQPIMDIASEFLWGAEMQDSMSAFAANYASMFVGVRRADGEQRLEWTEAHKEFSELFEFQLEQFISQQEFSVEEFVDACQVTGSAAPSALPAPGLRQKAGPAAVAASALRQRMDLVPSPLPRVLCRVLSDGGEVGLGGGAAAQDALDHGNGGWKGCGRAVQIVLAMIEYDYFVELMVDAAEDAVRLYVVPRPEGNARAFRKPPAG